MSADRFMNERIARVVYRVKDMAKAARQRVIGPDDLLKTARDYAEYHESAKKLDDIRKRFPGALDNPVDFTRAGTLSSGSPAGTVLPQIKREVGIASGDTFANTVDAVRRRFKDVIAPELKEKMMVAGEQLREAAKGGDKAAKAVLKDPQVVKFLKEVAKTRLAGVVVPPTGLEDELGLFFRQQLGELDQEDMVELERRHIARGGT